MSDVNFVKGLNVKTVKTKYGEILNCGMNLESIVCDENKVTESGWINFTLKKGKSGNWYAEVKRDKGVNEEG